MLKKKIKMKNKFKKHIPLYRAKSIKTRQYVIGYLKECTDTGPDVFWIQTEDFIDYQIDISTLAILDCFNLNNENQFIFASLSKDGKCGDIFITENSNEELDIWNRNDYGETVAIFTEHGVRFTEWHVEYDEEDSVFNVKYTKCIGIKE